MLIFILKSGSILCYYHVSHHGKYISIVKQSQNKIIWYSKSKCFINRHHIHWFWIIPLCISISAELGSTRVHWSKLESNTKYKVIHSWKSNQLKLQYIIIIVIMISSWISSTFAGFCRILQDSEGIC